MYPVSYFRVDVVNTPPGRPRSSSVSSLSRVGGHRTAVPANIHPPWSFTADISENVRSRRAHTVPTYGPARITSMLPVFRNKFPLNEFAGYGNPKSLWSHTRASRSQQLIMGYFRQTPGVEKP
ncbi:hypothetical protein MGG_16134 [Pyricularia oryzae 70-15]|uniref:Uncharacterized protein n=1 Tax=Pyricularia oryzae (strain 70-15 / ATCC MYA-4617 / FGSC 8958) TaxID=242507 RepID=G4MK95_PYRO7|nr:uncharacterized protein MGG_16134 [Pyricularia oryzae 70-15]EHA56686.1 hypothetical protein MGG_16134 [Pyricularia oryzae 70-15]